MIANTQNFIHLLFVLVLIFNQSLINSTPIELNLPISPTITPSQYKRLVSHCYINDYAAWLERQKELMMWLSLAKIWNLPIEENKIIQQELEQIRLQHECLRVIERLPLSIGPG